MNESCYYIPKQLFTSEYAEFSNESKLLFGIILAEAEKTRFIDELYELIKLNKDKNVRDLDDAQRMIEKFLQL